MAPVASFRVGTVVISEFAPVEGLRLQIYGWEKPFSVVRMHALK